MLLLLALGVGVIYWLNNSYQPMEQALEVFAHQQEVRVEVNDFMVFRPSQIRSETGIIFYPGGRVEPEAYAPLASQLASSGYLVAVVPMPLNLAVLGVNRASRLFLTESGIKSWYMAGHSLGGAMAARYAVNNSSKLEGLILMAAYPAESDDLSATELNVLSIYGSEDGRLSRSDIDASRQLLPPETRWLEIKGGNHSQFGWYGHQSGDKRATISREEQQQQIVAGIESFIAEIREE